MVWLDFNTVQDDLVSLIAGNVSSAKLVKKEADERDYSFSNMPLIDVRLTDMDPDIRSGRDYYVTLVFEVQITVFDLSDFNEAATLRQSVLVDVIETVRQNANFSSAIETSKIGPATFSTAKDENSGAFMAAATVQVSTEAFVDA